MCNYGIKMLISPIEQGYSINAKCSFSNFFVKWIMPFFLACPLLYINNVNREKTMDLYKMTALATDGL